eukprot:1845931-Pyramimonas_sp.AAC.1
MLAAGRLCSSGRPPTYEGEASGRADQPPSNMVAELAYGGQLSFYSSPSTALSCGLLTWWNIRVQWVCAKECT